MPAIGIKGSKRLCAGAHHDLPERVHIVGTDAPLGSSNMASVQLYLKQVVPIKFNDRPKEM